LCWLRGRRVTTMHKAKRLLWGVVVAVTVGSGVAAAQDVSKTYTDSHGRKVVFPLGDASFADGVVSFAVGTPPPRDPRWGDPKTAVGPPDYNARRVDPRSPANVVFGCAGSLVVRFADNVLVDVAGPDLYVFEVGPVIEPMRLAISQDGTTWTEVGDISGGHGGHRHREGCEARRALSIRPGPRLFQSRL